MGWTRMSLEAESEFSRDGLAKIITLSRQMYLSNPLINRGVGVQALYVWGQGINVGCEDEKANKSIQDFLEEPGNQATIFGHVSRTLAEVELQVTGNVFYALFAPIGAAKVGRVRSIPIEEIADIVRNPDDRAEPWFYKRVWSESSLDLISGAPHIETHTAYYPDWRYDPASKPQTIGGNEVHWDVPVYHVKVGGFAAMAFGVPEVYSALAWARAHKENLENWASVAKALARFAWKLKTAGGARAVQAAKAKLATTTGTTTSETNPPPVAASTFIEGSSVELDPIRTASVAAGPKDSRYLLLQVAAAMGLPETFFGDASVGSLATAQSLDRPTEFKFRDRQELWRGVYADLIAWHLEVAKIASTKAIAVDFPALLERDVDAYMTALVKGATLNDNAPVVIPDMRVLATLVLRALGEDDVEKTVKAMFPQGVAAPAQQEAQFGEALVDFRKALEVLVKGNGNATD